MSDKKIDQWLRRRFSQVGWILVGYYILMNILATLGITLEQLHQELLAVAAGDFSGNIDWDAVYGNAWGYIAAILVALVILCGWKGGDYWKDTLLVREKPMTIGVAVSALILCMGAQLVNSLWVSLLEFVMNCFGGSVIPMLEGISGDSDTLSMFLYISILGPVGEEILFRGYVLRSLQPYGKRFAILGSAVLFGLFHGNLLQIPFAFLMGLVMGYITVEYSLGWSIVLHIFNNLVLVDLLNRLTAGWSDMAYGILNLVLLGGSAVASVGILIRKREQIRNYNRREWIDRRCVKCFFLNPGMAVLSGIMIINMIACLFV